MSGFTMLLQANNLVKAFDGPPVLKGVSLTIRSGERVALMGQSGSGKTTLLNLLGLMDTPTEGNISLNGQSVSRLSDDERSALRRQKLGFIFQFFHLLPTLTVAENIALPSRLGNEKWTTADQARLCSLMEQLGIAEKLNQLPGALSGGQIQRAAIARALFHRPVLILADEPTGNLDSETSQQVLDVLETVCRETGTALLMVTHSEAACRIAERVLHMKDGLLLPEAVYAG